MERPTLSLLIGLLFGCTAAAQLPPPPSAAPVVHPCEEEKKLDLANLLLSALEQGRTDLIASALDPALGAAKQAEIMAALERAMPDAQRLRPRYERSAILVYPDAATTTVHLRYIETLPGHNADVIEHYFIGVSFRTERCDPYITAIEIVGEAEMMRRSAERNNDHSIPLEPPPPPFNVEH